MQVNTGHLDVSHKYLATLTDEISHDFYEESLLPCLHTTAPALPVSSLPHCIFVGRVSHQSKAKALPGTLIMPTYRKAIKQQII
jgi:hypothetical protein